MQPKRWWAAPNVPTLDELGFKDIDATFWHGLWAPKGTPPDVIAKLNAAVRVALADPTVQDRFKKVGQEIWPVEYQTPEALAAKQKAELAKLDAGHSGIAASRPNDKDGRARPA